MSTELILPEGVDKLSPAQKIVAGGLLGLGVLLFILMSPSIAFYLANLWLVALLSIPIVFIAFNPTLVWGVAKSLSWALTKKIISLDILSAMDRYYDWVNLKLATAMQSRESLNTTYLTIDQQVKDKEKSYKTNITKADDLDKLGNTIQSKISANKAVVDQQFIENLVPLRDDTKQRLDYVDEIIDVFKVKKEELGYTIESKKLEYKSLQDTYNSLSAVNTAMGGMGEANKLWNESVNQLTNQMNQFTSSIQSFENNLKPILEGARVDKQLADKEGMRLLEEFRNANFQLTTSIK